MSTTEQDGPTWFLARDGQQYGPITSLEMKKIIELGQLAETDLVWNETLTEWAPAQLAIDALTPPPPQPQPRPATELPPPVNPTRPTQPDPVQSAPAQYTDQPSPTVRDPEPEPVSNTSGRYSGAPASDPAPRGPGPTQPEEPRVGQSRQPEPTRSYEPAPRPDRPQPEGYADPGDYRQREPERPDYRSAGAQPTGLASEPTRRDVAVEDRYDDEDEPSAGGSIAFKAIAAGLLVALIGGGGWFAYQNRADLLGIVNDTGANASNAPVVRAPSADGTAGTLRTTTATGAGAGRITRSPFLDTVAWKSVTSAFPTWATEREQQAANMLQSGQTATAVRRHLIDEIAKLRRKHANDALAASPTALRSVANAFLANLRTLTSRSPEICYAFISKGETSPQILPLLDETDTSTPLLKQMHTVIDAIADGRSSPQTYLPPRQSDYSMISTELSKMGWTGTDMRLFGDPQKLAAAQPAKVCQLVTDWFTAQLMISDQAIQARLLVQSLRPVVAG